MRRFVILTSVVLSCLSMIGLSTALAGSSVGAQLSTLPVRTTAVTSTGASGEILTIAASVVNKSSVAQTVYVALEIYFPDGTVHSYSAQPSLAAGQSHTLKQNFKVTSAFPAGQYTVYGIGELGNNPCHRSEASVSIKLP